MEGEPLKRARVVAAALLAALLAACEGPGDGWQRQSGLVFGTQYNLTYRSRESHEAAVARRLAAYDASLSVYNPRSLLRQLNDSGSVRPDRDLWEVLAAARRVGELTHGAFDVTVEPLSRLWRFGPDQRDDTISVALCDELARRADSVKAFVGMGLLDITPGRVAKGDPRALVNANALAEGRGIDVAAGVLDSLGVTDYLVEIGGEIRCRGHSPRGTAWRVAVERPSVGKGPDRSGRQCVLAVTDCGVSTSGNYRQCYHVADGRLLQHTIDPRTGRPVQHHTRSVTAVGPSTMVTDALCTAIMVSGPDSLRAYVRSFERAGLGPCQAMAVYDGPDGEERTEQTPGFERLLDK